MRLSAVLVSISLSSVVNAQPYVLEDDYEPASFFDMFDFFTSADPTHGYVSYVDRTTAQNDGLISNNNGSIYMGVDSTNVASASGRASVRVTSKKTYNHGLIILDLSHMPGGICGTWPAFWTTGPSWPTNGEIDIIEGVNAATANGMTLHTDAGCSVSNRNNTQSGSLVTANCDVNAPGQATNAGCSIASTSLHTFGAGFNAMGGGVYAMEWTSAAISVYFFPRNAIPGDITSGTPDPSGWGAPQGMFSGACDIDSHVIDQKIVFDTTFCGDWAGNVWSTDAVCAPLAATCEAYGLFGVWYVAHDIHEYRFVHGFPLFHDIDFLCDLHHIHFPHRLRYTHILHILHHLHYTYILHILPYIHFLHNICYIHFLHILPYIHFLHILCYIHFLHILPYIHFLHKLRYTHFLHNLCHIHFIYDLHPIHDFLPLPDNFLFYNIIHTQLLGARGRGRAEHLLVKFRNVVDTAIALANITAARVVSDVGHRLASTI